jgi:hypothetical protein
LRLLVSFAFPLVSSIAYIFKLDAAVEYCPQNIFHALQQINQRLGNVDNSLQNIDNHVKIGLAQTANLRIVSRNTRLQAPLQLLPLQKTVSPVQLLLSTDYNAHD